MTGGRDVRYISLMIKSEAAKARRRAYLREYQRRARREWRIRMLALLGGKCVVCGTTEDLEFHHVDPASKEFNLSHIWSHRLERQMAELAKCELRCGKHHAVAHRRPDLPHGTWGKYKRGCRCEPCSELKRESGRIFMARWRAAGKDKSRRNFVSGVAKSGD